MKHTSPLLTLIVVMNSLLLTDVFAVEDNPSELRYGSPGARVFGVTGSSNADSKKAYSEKKETLYDLVGRIEKSLSSSEAKSLHDTMEGTTVRERYEWSYQKILYELVHTIKVYNCPYVKGNQLLAYPKDDGTTHPLLKDYSYQNFGKISELPVNYETVRAVLFPYGTINKHLVCGLTGGNSGDLDDRVSRDHIEPFSVSTDVDEESKESSEGGFHSPSTPSSTPEPESAPASPSRSGSSTPEPESAPASPSRSGSSTPEPEDAPASPSESRSSTPEPESAPASPSESRSSTPEPESAPASPSRSGSPTPEPERKKTGCVLV